MYILHITHYVCAYIVLLVRYRYVYMLPRHTMHMLRHTHQKPDISQLYSMHTDRDIHKKADISQLYTMLKPRHKYKEADISQLYSMHIHNKADISQLYRHIHKRQIFPSYLPCTCLKKADISQLYNQHTDRHTAYRHGRPLSRRTTQTDPPPASRTQTGTQIAATLSWLAGIQA